MMRRFLYLSVFFFLIQHSVFAQSESVATEESDTTESDWQFSASVYYYSLPEETDNILPIIYADYKSIHIEARYNYEDKNTTSIFAGYRFEAGNKLEAGITPIVGIVFGNTDGFAPGLLLDLAYSKFDFYSESEWVLDFESREYNFIYTWSELAFNPNDNIRTGLSANRTKIYQTDREIQHGLFAEYSFGKLSAGLHYFNPFSEDYFFVALVSVEF